MTPVTQSAVYLKALHGNASRANTLNELCRVRRWLTRECP